MVNYVIERAYAKINLVLNITGVSGNMHLIDSIVTPFEIYDEIKISKNCINKTVINYTNLIAGIKNDSALTAAELIRKEYNLDGIDIEIKKNIPFKAGLGGSAADAGAIARGMERLFNLEKIPLSLLLKIGSDAPYMYMGGNKRVRGTGEIVTPVNLPEMYKVVLIEKNGVETKKAFKYYDKYGGENQNIDIFLENIKVNKAIFSNALQKASEKLNENIYRAVKLLKDCGFEHCCMTGSGSGVFGITYDKEEFNTKLNELIRKNTVFGILIG